MCRGSWGHKESELEPDEWTELKELLRCKDIIQEKVKEKDLGKIIEKGKNVHDKFVSKYYFYKYKIFNNLSKIKRICI